MKTTITHDSVNNTYTIVIAGQSLTTLSFADLQDIESVVSTFTMNTLLEQEHAAHPQPFQEGCWICKGHETHPDDQGADGIIK